MNDLEKQSHSLSQIVDDLSAKVADNNLFAETMSILSSKE